VSVSRSVPKTADMTKSAATAVSRSEIPNTSGEVRQRWRGVACSVNRIGTEETVVVEAGGSCHCCVRLV